MLKSLDRVDRRVSPDIRYPRLKCNYKPQNNVQKCYHAIANDAALSIHICLISVQTSARDKLQDYMKYFEANRLATAPLMLNSPHYPIDIFQKSLNIAVQINGQKENTYQHLLASLRPSPCVL